ncbi:MAG TPA: hypothetical protein PK052_11420 [Anaerohalosphaeraceae bacterium]|nr:hypothetical protein [Anaerohalosphaeraceae bacterium]HOL32578.1 hypothetical protein [Anaerohalosphaeraceae bacterium]HOM76313.1 hypothetical protein [Anaerohalosphaeraceae bacterium]HPC64503.1 hypothetical protein [Anaerohalosphaeraceae bacterium]HPO69729.1 hypothetical protein [Anaerohalosphaeraceae bacterium]
MKQSPEEKKLEDLLRSTAIVAGGFMGTDPRHPADVIQEDILETEKRGFTPAQLAQRMHELTELAKPYLGCWVETCRGKIRVKTEEFKGALICPWPHPGLFDKRVTAAERLDTGEKIQWTDLNIHLIAEHSFFEGRGAFFRIEPAEIIRILFEGLT